MTTALPRTRLALQTLDDRITPVLGAFGQAPNVLPGQGYDGVVRLVSGGGSGTGELMLNGRQILTAAHVVTNNQGVVNPGGVTVQFDMANGGRIEYAVPVAGITLHPGWTGGGADDLAILTLPSLAPSGAGVDAANRYALYRNTDEIGKDITIVGYGSFGTGTTGEQAPDGANKRIASNRYEALGGQIGADDRTIYYDVDNGQAANDAFGRILGVNQLGVANEGTGGRGDSGGPVFIFIGTTPFIAGTTTAGPNADNPPNPAVLNPAVDAGIGSISLDTRMSAYAGWIDGVGAPPHVLTLDLRVQVAGLDVAADAVLVRVQNGNLELLVNGVVYQSEPLAGVTNLTLIGDGAEPAPFRTTVTLDASVPQALPVVFQRILQVQDNRTNQVINPAGNAAVLPPDAGAAAPENRPEPALDLAQFPNALAPTRLTAVGAGAGGTSRVQVFDARTGAIVRDFVAFEAGFTGGVRTAVGDINGDFTDDIIVAVAGGGGSRVKVIDGTTGAVIRDFFAFGAAFTGGVSVAAGDVDGDGQDDIVVGAGAGGASHVKVFSGADGSLLDSFYAYGAGYTGGVNVAVADLDNDGFADILTGTGAGGAAHVKVFSGADDSLLRSFYAYATTFTGGVFVSAGDLDGDGRADIVTGAGVGGGPNVKAFSGADNNALLGSFQAYGNGLTSGVRVAVVDADGDGLADIATGPGTNSGPQVKVFKGTTFGALQTRTAFGGQFNGGVYVGGRG